MAKCFLFLLYALCPMWTLFCFLLKVHALLSGSQWVLWSMLPFGKAWGQVNGGIITGRLHFSSINNKEAYWSSPCGREERMVEGFVSCLHCDKTSKVLVHDILFDMRGCVPKLRDASKYKLIYFGFMCRSLWVSRYAQKITRSSN